MNETRIDEELKPPFKKQNLVPPGLEERLDPKPRFKNPSYKGSEKLKDKVALITGGDSGIGRAVAVLFAREGADVAITYLPEEESDARKTCEAIEEEGQNSLMIKADLTQQDAPERIISKLAEEFGRIDILVNNAGFQMHQDDFDHLSFEQFQHTFEVNLFSYFKMVKAAIPHFQSGGAIINTGSILGYTGNGNLIDYSATKGAVHNLTKSLAKSLISKNIRVNSVAPGPVWTPLNPAERKPAEVASFGEDTLFERPAQPEEIAPAYVYLASDITASYVTGETINLFGVATGGN